MSKKTILILLLIFIPFNLFMKYGTTPETLRVYEFFAFIVSPILALIGYAVSLYFDKKK